MASSVSPTVAEPGGKGSGRTPLPWLNDGEVAAENERLRRRVADLTAERDYLVPHFARAHDNSVRCLSGGPLLNQHVDVPVLALMEMRIEASAVSGLLSEDVSFESAMLAPQTLIWLRSSTLQLTGRRFRSCWRTSPPARGPWISC